VTCRQSRPEVDQPSSWPTGRRNESRRPPVASRRPPLAGHPLSASHGRTTDMSLRRRRGVVNVTSNLVPDRSDDEPGGRGLFLTLRAAFILGASACVAFAAGLLTDHATRSMPAACLVAGPALHATLISAAPRLALRGRAPLPARVLLPLGATRCRGHAVCWTGSHACLRRPPGRRRQVARGCGSWPRRAGRWQHPGLGDRRQPDLGLPFRGYSP